MFYIWRMCFVKNVLLSLLYLFTRTIDYRLHYENFDILKIWWIENHYAIIMTDSFCFYSTPGFLGFFNFWHFQKLSNDWYMFSRYKRSMILIQWKIIFSTSPKIELSCDIKSLFRKSVDKKLKISTSIFPPVLLHFFDAFYDNLIPLSNIFRSQKKNY